MSDQLEVKQLQILVHEFIFHITFRSHYYNWDSWELKNGKSMRNDRWTVLYSHKYLVINPLSAYCWCQIGAWSTFRSRLCRNDLQNSLIISWIKPNVIQEIQQQMKNTNLDKTVNNLANKFRHTTNGVDSGIKAFRELDPIHFSFCMWIFICSRLSAKI